MKKIRMSMLLLVVATVILAACGPAATPEPEVVEEPDVVEEPSVAEATPEEAAAAPEEKAEEEEPIKIVWWSHWAEETNKREVLETVAADYMAEHPNVEIELVWWQKAEMFAAIQNTMTAGEGFPDMFYYDRTAPQIQAAGWTADLTNGINWDNVEPWAKEAWKVDDGVYALTVEAATLELYVNNGLFEELGIEIPEDRQFDQDEFYEVAKICKDAGYDVFASASQWWGSGSLLYWYALLHELGGEEFTKYFNGELPVDTPETREALEWAESVMALPAVPEVYSTHTLAEAHQYFHTQQKACMMPVGSWYTGRAFVPEEAGGQPADFDLSCIRWPAIDGGVDNDSHILYAAGSLAAAELSPNKDVAIDIINYFAQEKYGNLWMANTAVQTGIKTNLDTMPATDYDWYFAEYNTCKAGAELFVLNVFSQPPDFKAVWNQVFNEGLPMRQIELDQGLEMLEAARPQ